MAILKSEEARALYTTRFALMGGQGVVRFVDSRGIALATRVARAAEAEALRIERKFSRYRDSSVVSNINRNAGRTPVAADAETIALVESSLELARLTGGRFDPTSGVFRRAWDFRSGRVPEPETLSRLCELVDHRALSVTDGTVFLRRPDMELDLGGVGKEYAVDRVCDLLRAEGVESGIVNFAGDVGTLGGRGDGRPWSIGVADPRSQGRCRFAVRLIGAGGVATSGDYERSFIKDGVRYHHLLDARTGYPTCGIAAVTAVAASASSAGRAATAAFLLGAAEGLALLENLTGIEGVLICDDGTLHATSGMGMISDLPGSLYAAYPTV